MKVVLLDKLGRLGGIGSQVNVKAGYARNFLIPYGKAVPATAANIAEFEARRAELESIAAASRSAAEARAATLATVVVTIGANAGEEGKLFGSVGTRDIAEAITRLGFEVNKSEVLMPHGVIREVGEYDIALQLHSDVSQVVKVQVVPE